MAVTITCDPMLEPGGTCFAGRRYQIGSAYMWSPGGDADAYVAFVGLNYLVNVAGDVYARQPDGTLTPHTAITSEHVVFRPVAGDPTFVSTHVFLTEYASISGVGSDGDSNELAGLLARLHDLQTRIDVLEGQVIEREQTIAALRAGVVMVGSDMSAPVPGSLEWLTSDDELHQNADPEAPTSSTGVGQVGESEGFHTSLSPTDPPRRGPGRPKGSKNRPKDEQL
jgi:hypothetical protein